VGARGAPRDDVHLRFPTRRGYGNLSAISDTDDDARLPYPEVKMEDIVPEGYNEDAAEARRVSKMEEETHWNCKPGMEDVLRLSTLVAEY
jgi:hypothetical protein